MKWFWYVLGWILGIAALWSFIVLVAWLSSQGSISHLPFKEQLAPLSIGVGGIVVVFGLLLGSIYSISKWADS